MKTTHWKCQECNGVYPDSAILTGRNPFDDSPVSIIHGCPHCFAIDKEHMVCDEPNCQEIAECGTPVMNGYRQTCSSHIPRNTSVTE